jgi:hypothetical protein
MKLRTFIGDGRLVTTAATNRGSQRNCGTGAHWMILLILAFIALVAWLKYSID